MKHFLIILILLCCSALPAISGEDIRFLLDTEQFHYLTKFAPQISALLETNPEEVQTILSYAQRSGDNALALRCHWLKVEREHSLEDALQWLQLAEIVELDSLELGGKVEWLQEIFAAPEDKLILDYYLFGTPDEVYMEQIKHLDTYNSVIEALAKSWIDEISVQRSDSLALELIDRFEESFPRSRWKQVAYYYRLYHLSQRQDFLGTSALIGSCARLDPVHSYISVLYLLSPAYRKAHPEEENSAILKQASELLEIEDGSIEQSYQVLYEVYDRQHWCNRIALTKAKVLYYQLLAQYGLFGDEEDIGALFAKPYSLFNSLLMSLENISFVNNDSGEQAELHYWKGKTQALYNNRHFQLMAVKNFAQALVLGAPRRKYDDLARKEIEAIKARLGVPTELHAWVRQLLRYDGIRFEEHPFPDKRYTRVAIGDYDNDGYNDLLFNGNALYRNLQGTGFEDVSEGTISRALRSNGGLWADFNQDGLLDFVAISHAEDGEGDTLMKNMDGTRFVSVNERAGDIDDRSPTEGAAWVDIDAQGFPSLYCANYEKWQQRSGYPDFFWHNSGGYFSDASQERGFRLPDYSVNPGLAGRGVAPADFDNDGKQEILVTNYRLMRNFCWKQADSLFVDVAALYGLSGTYKNGYYGHSIGADWGDYDNDGDLDLFIANLAHPRYIEISDVSMLLRNDGLASYVVESDTLYYWKFTDVTREAGITYDELHSDPLWFDADNDGWLDLFITSVYENDRSYLYRNNRDGTFTDITWLANARVYNGWGNASADLDRDSLPDLVVGSGNGTKILLNRTHTTNKALYLKPVWKSGAVAIAADWQEFHQFPNSPAFGTRIQVTVEDRNGRHRNLIRELSSAKGTTSQNAPELHFGLGNGRVVSIERIDYEKD